MNRWTLIIISFTSTLFTEPKGSIHDAWTDWLIGQKEKTEEQTKDEIVELEDIENESEDE